MHNLIETLASLHKTYPDAFSLEETLALTAEATSELNTFSPPGIKDTLAQENEHLEELLFAKVNTKLASCRLCGRCEGRTQVVLGEGDRSAKLFIVAPDASWIDDRTGLPLSGWLEVKASRCGGCSGFGECYFGLMSGSTTEPERRCSYQKEEDETQIKSALNFPLQLNFPGQAFDKALTLTKEGRPAWHTLAEKRKSLKLEGKIKIPAARVYITAAVRCYHKEIPTIEERLACRPWLLIERRFVKAPVTLVLGKDALTSVLGYVPEDEEYETLKAHPHDTLEWGRVFVTDWPAPPEELAMVIKKALEFTAMPIVASVTSVTAQPSLLEGE